MGHRAAPVVSLIMPVHNAGEFLAPAIESVLAQTCREIELVVCDDASTDGSLEVVRRYAGQDSRVRVIDSGATQRRGHATTLAAAHAHAAAPFIGWIDADDLVFPGAVARTLQALRAEPDVGMVYTDHAMIDERGRALGVGTRSRIPFSNDRMLVDFITFHFRLYRRDVFERCGGINTSYPAAADYDFCLRACEVTRVARVPEVLYAYRQHRASISQARRIEQIDASARAIREALARRGLDQTVELRYEVVAKYALHRRPAQGSPPSDAPPPTPSARETLDALARALASAKTP
jgi:glycosyltransferase involved in cell wall biosynthesis